MRTPPKLLYFSISCQLKNFEEIGSFLALVNKVSMKQQPGSTVITCYPDHRSSIFILLKVLLERQVRLTIFFFQQYKLFFFLHFRPPIFRLMQYKGLVQQMVSDICKHIVEAFFHSYISILSLFSRSSPIIAVKEVTHQGRIQSLMPPFLRQPEISQWLTVFFKDILSFRTFDSVAISRKPDRASAIHQSSLFVRH